ncbi:hypothetical protein JHW43_009604 [Diplocarpon mali]|nr:hypothetical protein JHW43_009604 [Diplocarpon mali]
MRWSPVSASAIASGAPLNLLCQVTDQRSYQSRHQHQHQHQHITFPCQLPCEDRWPAGYSTTPESRAEQSREERKQRQDPRQRAESREHIGESKTQPPTIAAAAESTTGVRPGAKSRAPADGSFSASRGEEPCMPEARKAAHTRSPPRPLSTSHPRPSSSLLVALHSPHPLPSSPCTPRRRTEAGGVSGSASGHLPARRPAGTGRRCDPSAPTARGTTPRLMLRLLDPVPPRVLGVGSLQLGGGPRDDAASLARSLEVVGAPSCIKCCQPAPATKPAATYLTRLHPRPAPSPPPVAG